MTSNSIDWHPVRPKIFSTVLHIAGGIAVSTVLFTLVYWSISQPDTKPAEEEIPNSLSVAIPPPPVPDSMTRELPQLERENVRPIVFENDSFDFEASTLDVDYSPSQSVDTLAKLEMNLSKLKVTRSDLDDMVVYSRSELTRTLVPIWRPFPPVSKRIKGKNSVRVTFTVNTEGNVEDVFILESTNNELNADAVKGVKQWTFEPPIRNKKKVRARVTIRIDFNSSTTPFSL